MRIVLARSILSGALVLAPAVLASGTAAFPTDSAWAKDGGSGGSGGGNSGGNSGSGGSGGSGSGQGGGGSGSSGKGGSGDGNSGKGSGDDRSGSNSGSGQRGKTAKAASRAERSRVVWSSRQGGTVEVRYADGWSERVDGKGYTLRDPSRRVVVSRPAKSADLSRLGAMTE